MKRVLIVVYAWPPAGGPGVQRCLKFVKYLPTLGWEPVILTVKNPEASADDSSLVAQIPKELKIYKTNSIEPFTLYKKLTGRKPDEKLETGLLIADGKKSLPERFASWIRLNCFIPDARIGWWPNAITAGKSIIENENIDLIFSSGPPHTAHLIGRSLSKSMHIPWVADFRDPWVDIDYYRIVKRSMVATRLDEKFEATCIQTAVAATTVSQGLVELLVSKPNAPKVHLLPNGYDTSDLPPRNHFSNQPDAPHSIYYGGSLSSDRIPHALVDAMTEITRADKDSPLRLSLAGSCCSAFRTLIETRGLQNNFNEMGQLPHHKASAELVNADISLLVINQVSGNELIVTGKIFEYMGAGNPILGIGPTNGDAAKLLNDTGSGEMFDYEDHVGVANFLRKSLINKRAFRESFPFKCEAYSRERLTAQLTTIFDDCVSAAPGCSKVRTT